MLKWLPDCAAGVEHFSESGGAHDRWVYIKIKITNKDTFDLTVQSTSAFTSAGKTVKISKMTTYLKLRSFICFVRNETNGMMLAFMNRPGDEDGDGGRQKSQSDDRSHTLPPQLSGELEDSEPGDRSLDPEESLSSSCGSRSDANCA